VLQIEKVWNDEAVPLVEVEVWQLRWVVWLVWGVLMEEALHFGGQIEASVCWKFEQNALQHLKQALVALPYWADVESIALGVSRGVS
jgi:hypothetical protein